MTQLSATCKTILGQLGEVLRQIHADDFSKPSASLSGATVGQHFRHTIEFFICLEDGFEKGVINYDKRNHDKLIESDKFVASLALDRILNFVSQARDKKNLKLEVAYERESWITIESNCQRELVYNIEHAVHHMAMMKIGLREIAPYIQLPADFGVAVSTLWYKEHQQELAGRGKE